MTSGTKLEEDQLEILKGVLETAGRKSAETISIMIDSNVEAKIKNVIANSFDMSNEKENKLTMIVFSELEIGKNGLALFILYEDSARKMANILLGRDKDNDFGEFSDTEKSAVKEVGNIVMGNFLGEVSDYFDISIMHTPPKLAESFNVLSVEYGIELDGIFEDAVIADIKFIAEGVGIKGKYLMIPSEELTKIFIDYLSSK